MLAVVMAINAAGVSASGRLGAWMTWGQILSMFVLGGLGLARIVADPGRLRLLEPFPHPASLAVLTTMGIIYVAFQGYVVISQAGDESIDPRRSLPRAILRTALLAGVGCLLAAVALLAAVSPADLGSAVTPARWAAWVDRVGGPDTVLAVAIARLAPRLGPVLLAVTVFGGAAAALNAVLFSAARALYAMGRDRTLPEALARVSRRRRSPWVAIVGTGTLMAALAILVPTMTDMVALTSVMFLCLLLIVNLSCLRLRRRHGDELSYGFVMPLFPLVPILAILGNAVLLVCVARAEPLATATGAACILVGGLVYRLYGRQHVATSRDEIISFRDTAPAAKTGFRILLPVATPDEALERIMPTMRLAEAFQAQVELLHMVSIPDQVPLADAGRYLDVGREAMTEATLYLRSRFTFHESIRYCRTPARGILSAAREHQTDLLILGWRGRTSRTDVLFGTTLDPILEQAPCDTIVLRGCNQRSYRRVLVPFTDGPDGHLALRLAGLLADPAEGRIRVLTVVPPGQAAPVLDAAVDRQADALALPRDRVTTEMRVSRDLFGALAEASAEADLVIVGATRSRGVSRLALRPPAEVLSQRFTGALIMVRAAGPMASWLNRWL